MSREPKIGRIDSDEKMKDLWANNFDQKSEYFQKKENLKTINRQKNSEVSEHFSTNINFKSRQIFS